MAVVQRGLFRIHSLSQINIRCLSGSSGGKDIKKSVFISQSKDVYTNLALEDWLYHNFDFSRHHILMLWQNTPSVTIGNEQNPWHELNIPEMQNVTEDGVRFARRNTGGDTVYHDEGILNMTFFTSKDKYNKKYNLEIIKRAIFREFGTKIDLDSHELKIRNEKQISKNSHKIGHPSAYHHCNILVNEDENKSYKNKIFQKEGIDIISNVIKQKKPNLMNLNDANRKVTVSGLLKAVGWEYMRTESLRLRDGGTELAYQQKGFQMVNPNEKWFPGITEIRNNLMSWDWCYGATPTFTISRSFSVPGHLLNGIDVTNNKELKITMMVERGRISSVTLYMPPGLSSSGFMGEAKVVTTLRGQKFSDDALNSLEWSLGGLIDDKEKFVTECVKQVMTSV